MLCSSVMRHVAPLWNLAKIEASPKLIKYVLPTFFEDKQIRENIRCYSSTPSPCGTLSAVCNINIFSVLVHRFINVFLLRLTVYVYRQEETRYYQMFVIRVQKPSNFLDVNWGASTQAHSYRNAILGVTRLENTDEHVKNYRKTA